jgi:hypothetical protein
VDNSYFPLKSAIVDDRGRDSPWEFDMRVEIIAEDIFDLTPGEVISTMLPGDIEHFGIVTEQHTIISASKMWKAVVEELPLEFSRGPRLYAHGTWSDQPWQQTVWNARSQLGKAYRLFDGNCEHFVRFCHGLRQESPQVQAAVAGLIIGGAVLWAIAA